VKHVGKWVGILLVLLILGVVSVPFLINVDEFRPTLQSELTNALGMTVTLGNLQLKILRGEVASNAVRTGNQPAGALVAASVTAPLFQGVIVLLPTPRIRIARFPGSDCDRRLWLPPARAVGPIGR